MLTPIEIENNNKKVGILAPSGGHGAQLDYMDFTIVQYTASHLYAIEWSFTCDNELVGLKVFAMDYSNYKNYLLNKSHIKYYTLSDGHKKQDNGVFGIPYENTWFLIFLNDDPDQVFSRLMNPRKLESNTA